MKALILAGGFGSRLMPVISDRPKVMAPVNGKPFLELILEKLKDNNITKAVLAVGYLSGYISDYFGSGATIGMEINYSIEDLPLGTAGAVRKALDKLDDIFLVMNGDTYFDIDYRDLIKIHGQNPGEVTIVVNKQTTSQRRGMVKLDSNNKIISFEEVETDRLEKNQYVNAGIYVMSKKIARLIKTDQKISLENDFFPKLLAQKRDLYGFKTKGAFIDIGTPESYNRAISLLKL